MSPSSTSSSEPSGFGRLDVRAVLLALGILLGIELGVSRSDWLWRRAPNTMVGAFFAIEREVLAKAAPPTVVFVGSSRMRDAVAPRQLEGALHLPRGGVMNLGLTGGTPYEALLYYERHRALLQKSRVLVVGVEDWYWNEGVARDEVELLFATTSDRVRWARQRRELGLLVGAVWRTPELQDALEKFGASFATGVKSIKFHEDRVVWRAASAVSDVGPAKTDVDGAIAHVMQSYAPGPGYEDSLRRLLALAREDGVRTFVVQLPLRDAYRAALDKKHPGMQPYVRERVKALETELGARVALYESGARVGIPDDRFYDYGHFTEDGARRMNAVWAELLGASLAQ